MCIYIQCIGTSDLSHVPLWVTSEVSTFQLKLLEEWRAASTVGTNDVSYSGNMIIM